MPRHAHPATMIRDADHLEGEQSAVLVKVNGIEVPVPVEDEAEAHRIIEYLERMNEVKHAIGALADHAPNPERVSDPDAYVAIDHLAELDEALNGGV